MTRAEVLVFGSSPEVLEGRRLSFVSKSSEPVVYCKNKKSCVLGHVWIMCFIHLEHEVFQKKVTKVPENSQGGLDLEMTQYEL